MIRRESIGYTSDRVTELSEQQNIKRQKFGEDVNTVSLSNSNNTSNTISGSLSSNNLPFGNSNNNPIIPSNPILTNTLNSNTNLITKSNSMSFVNGIALPDPSLVPPTEFIQLIQKSQQVCFFTNKFIFIK